MPKRIVYLSPFDSGLITGGIKVMHRHVEMLCDLGFDATIFSPAGRPTWMESRASLYAHNNPHAERDNLMVFPEILSGDLGRAARTPTPAAKALLCQNQYSIFSETIPSHTLQSMGFTGALTVGRVAQTFLERVLAPSLFGVIPVWVDERVFFPREKRVRIAVFPRKLPKLYALIRQIFVLKYPRLAVVPWELIDSAPEAVTAEVLGGAAVFLSLCDRESVGLTALEAMASGCVVVGFHGYGGLEYATEENGVWLRPDFLEETADALADAVEAVERDAPRAHALRAGAIETARTFHRGATREALREHFAMLCA